MIRLGRSRRLELCVGVRISKVRTILVASSIQRLANRPPTKSVLGGHRWRLILFRSMAVLGGIMLPLIILEMSLRMFGPFLPGNYDTGPYIERHPVLGHFHVPNFSGWIKSPWFTTRIEISSLGLRDPRSTYTKPPQTFRVLALGDSFVEAVQVDASEMITTRLEYMLNSSASRHIEVINAGVGAYVTTQ